MWIIFKDFRGCSILDMPESREKAAQIDLWAEQPSEKAYVSEI